jgi:RNA-directed DNA polymerase
MMNKRQSPFDQLCDTECLLHAAKRVIAKRGAAGVDQISLAEYVRDLAANIEDLAARLRAGRYYALPVRAVEIAKNGGGKRKIGVLAIEDRIVQRAALAVLEPLFEPSFLACSFGFRPNRSTVMAVQRVLDLRAAGCQFIVDADVEHCFDALDHDLLMELFSARVRDKRMQALVRMWLDTGMTLPKAAHFAAGGPVERLTDWLSEALPNAMDSTAAHLLGDSGMNGYGSAQLLGEEYGAQPEPDAWRKQARKEALKRLGRDGLLLALTHAGRARRLLSPTALALTGGAVLAAAAAPAAARAVKRYLDPEAERLRGILQGGPLSPLLANLYLHEFDRVMTQAGLQLVRYADDFVIVCRSKPDAERALASAAQALQTLRLRLHPQKTRIVHFNDGLDFLGYRFAQFENTAAPISDKATTPLVTALAETRDRLAPKLTQLGERAAQQVKDKTGRLRSLIKRR